MKSKIKGRRKTEKICSQYCGKVFRLGAGTLTCNTFPTMHNKHNFTSFYVQSSLLNAISE